MSVNTPKKLRVRLECDIGHATDLWDAALLRAVRDFAMASDDIAATIGPREEPDLEACVLMLVDALVRNAEAIHSVAVVPLFPSVETGRDARLAYGGDRKPNGRPPQPIVAAHGSAVPANGAIPHAQDGS